MITFYYTIETLLNRISTEILYKIKNRGGFNNSIVDAEHLILEYLNTGGSEIASKLSSPIAVELADLDPVLEPYEFDATYTDPDTDEETENCIIFRIIPPEKFDSTIKKIMDRTIEDTLIAYCVWNWLFDSNIQGWQLFKDKYDSHFNSLRMMFTKRIKLVRTYKY